MRRTAACAAALALAAVAVAVDAAVCGAYTDVTIHDEAQWGEYQMDPNPAGFNGGGYIPDDVDCYQCFRVTNVDGHYLEIMLDGGAGSNLCVEEDVVAGGMVECNSNGRLRFCAPMYQSTFNFRVTTGPTCSESSTSFFYRARISDEAVGGEMDWCDYVDPLTTRFPSQLPIDASDTPTPGAPGGIGVPDGGNWGTRLTVASGSLMALLVALVVALVA